MRPRCIAIQQLRPRLLACAARGQCLVASRSSAFETGTGKASVTSVAVTSADQGQLRVGVRAAVSADFFLSNGLFQRSGCLDSLILRRRARTTSTTTTDAAAASAVPPSPLQMPSQPQVTPAAESSSTPLAQLPPHRRRQQARKLASNDADAPDSVLPSNASSTLSTIAAAQPHRSTRRLLPALLSLAKPRLTVLVVLTAMAPYALYLMPEMLSPSMTATPSLSPLTLLFLTTGTALCSASANALNMLYEPSTDAKMSRTRNRPLVRGLVSARTAAVFAVVSGVVGVGTLYFGVNPTVSVLGLANIALYAGVYTPLKVVTAANTWVGAVVGGIPPLMGWAAAAGEAATRDGSWRELLFASDGSSTGGWLLAALLFAWQFPHFMALSWPIRDEYRAAGLRMLAWTNPARNARVALRYSLVFAPLCVALCVAGVTDWTFSLTSLPVNAWLAREAVRFWRAGGHAGSARGLFWASVWHLPAVMMLALLHKRGLWARAWAAVTGSGQGGGEEVGDGEEQGMWVDEEGELGEMAAMAAAGRVVERDAGASR